MPFSLALMIPSQRVTTAFSITHQDGTTLLDEKFCIELTTHHIWPRLVALGTSGASVQNISVPCSFSNIPAPVRLEIAP